MREHVCYACLNVEDEKHFILDCVVYVDLRKKLFVAVENLTLKEKAEKIEEVMKTDWEPTRVRRTHGRSGRSGVEFGCVRLTHLRRLIIADERCDAAMALLRSFIRGLDWATYCLFV